MTLLSRIKIWIRPPFLNQSVKSVIFKTSKSFNNQQVCHLKKQCQNGSNSNYLEDMNIFKFWTKFELIWIKFELNYKEVKSIIRSFFWIQPPEVENGGQMVCSWNLIFLRDSTVQPLFWCQIRSNLTSRRSKSTVQPLFTPMLSD